MKKIIFAALFLLLACASISYAQCSGGFCRSRSVSFGFSSFGTPSYALPAYASPVTYVSPPVTYVSPPVTYVESPVVTEVIASPVVRTKTVSYYFYVP